MIIIFDGYKFTIPETITVMFVMKKNSPELEIPEYSLKGLLIKGNPESAVNPLNTLLKGGAIPSNLTVHSSIIKTPIMPAYTNDSRIKILPIVKIKFKSIRYINTR